MYVSFVESGSVLLTHDMDRVPGPGEEVQIKGELFVVQNTPIRNVPTQFPSGTKYVAAVTVAKPRKAKKAEKVQE